MPGPDWIGLGSGGVEFGWLCIGLDINLHPLYNGVQLRFHNPNPHRFPNHTIQSNPYDPIGSGRLWPNPTKVVRQKDLKKGSE